jgi:hypothetical protein
MENNNIADISTFENIQNQANTAMGCQPVSGNSVFNDVLVTNVTKQDVQSFESYLSSTEVGLKQYKELQKKGDTEQAAKLKQQLQRQIAGTEDLYKQFTDEIRGYGVSLDKIKKRNDAIKAELR